MAATAATTAAAVADSVRRRLYRRHLVFLAPRSTLASVRACRSADGSAAVSPAMAGMAVLRALWAHADPKHARTSRPRAPVARWPAASRRPVPRRLNGTLRSAASKPRAIMASSTGQAHDLIESRPLNCIRRCYRPTLEW